LDLAVRTVCLFCLPNHRYFVDPGESEKEPTDAKNKAGGHHVSHGSHKQRKRRKRMDASNMYGPMGASRTRMVSTLVEPIFVVVFFAVSLTANSTIPYVVVQAHWVSSSAAFFAPSHLLIVAAFLMIIIAETAHPGRQPVRPL
jgi:hypothetical protein